MKTGINIMIFILLFVENCHDTMRCMICIRTGSNLLEMNRFRSHTGKEFTLLPKNIIFLKTPLQEY